MRYETKKKIVIAMHFFTWPFSLVSILDYKVRGSEQSFQFCAMFLSLLPGRIGIYIRSSFYMQTLYRSSYDLHVGFCSWFAHPTAEVGKNIGLGSFSIIGTATIENNVLIGSRVSILSGKFQHGNWKDGINVEDKDVRYDRVKIGKNSWLGEGCIIMSDIGSNCIVSAGSVVTKPMKSNATAIGNPARFLPQDYKNCTKDER